MSQVHAPAPAFNPAPMIARWLERRLSSTINGPLAESLLYGITVNDPSLLATGADDAGRASFLGAFDVGDVHACSPTAIGAFDALAVVAGVWLPTPGGAPDRPMAPLRFTGRRRARAVAAVTDEGSACAVRFDDDPEHVVMLAGPVVAGLVVPLAVLWTQLAGGRALGPRRPSSARRS